MNAEPVITKSSCPLCKRELVTSWVMDDIPFFGEVMHIVSSCECGLRYADTLIMAQREPVRYELKIEGQEDLNVRLVRSTSGTIRIPELGIDIEPGPASESFVSNIEGVLDRVEEILKNVLLWDEKEKIERAKELLSIFEKIKAGEYRITVVIEDPFGNSAIISDKAIKHGLAEEEAAQLKTGLFENSVKY